MLPFLCSFAADSMSRSMSFWPSTIATRSSSACVALKSMRFIALFSRAHGQDKPRAYLMCRLVSHFRSWDHENAVVLLVGFQSLHCRTANSADMLLARCSITITGWITNRLCSLRVRAVGGENSHRRMYKQPSRNASSGQIINKMKDLSNASTVEVGA